MKKILNLIVVIACHMHLMAQDKPVLDPSQYIVKDITYDYDLISGKVNQISYQGGQDDQLMHRYEYDGDNRITTVYTSTDGTTWTKDASYQYYAHGPLAKTELGALKVETQNYAYTLQGWIKGVQGQSFSYALGYNTADYKGINATAYGGEQVGLKATPVANNASGKSTGLFNGNIATWATNTPALAAKGVENMANQYTYDQLNRIKSSTVLGRGDQYRTKYSYDPSGNILALQRYNEAGQKFDAFRYNYEDKKSGYLANTNRLRSVDDTIVNQALHEEDLEDQDVDNYQYDDIGNLSYDRQEEIAKIEWTVYGKVRSIIRNEGSFKPNLAFEYDASGNRTTKTSVIGKNVTKTYYIRDANRNIMSTYDNQNTSSLLVTKELYLYGRSRLGVVENSVRNYELTDHIDNTRSIINESKEVKGALEYYAFGMILAKIENGYRHGFNGKEKDTEGIGGGGSTYDYGFRVYNSQLGKFLSIDPLFKTYPWFTPFQFSGNRPIVAIDMDGLENDDKNKEVSQSDPNKPNAQVSTVKTSGEKSTTNTAPNASFGLGPIKTSINFGTGIEIAYKVENLDLTKCKIEEVQIEKDFGGLGKMPYTTAKVQVGEYSVEIERTVIDYQVYGKLNETKFRVPKHNASNVPDNPSAGNYGIDPASGTIYGYDAPGIAFDYLKPGKDFGGMDMVMQVMNFKEKIVVRDSHGNIVASSNETTWTSQVAVKKNLQGEWEFIPTQTFIKEGTTDVKSLEKKLGIGN